MAEDDIVQKIVIQADDQASQALSKIGQDAQTSFDQIQKAAQQAGVSVEQFGQLSQKTQQQYIQLSQQVRDSGKDLASATQQAGNAVTQTSSAIKDLGGKTEITHGQLRTMSLVLRELDLGPLAQMTHLFGAVGLSFGAFATGTVAVLALAEGIKKLIESASEAAEVFDKLSKASGTSVQDLSAWQSAFAQTGVSVDEFGKAFSNLAENIIEQSAKIGNAIAESNKQVADAELAALKAAQAASSHPETYNQAIKAAEANEKYATASAAAAKANEVFANSLPMVIGQFQQLSEGITATINPLTSVKTQTEAVYAVLAKAGVSVKDFGNGLSGLGADLNKIIPLLANIFKGLTPLQAQELGKALKLPDDVIESLIKGGDALKRLQEEAQKTAITDQQVKSLKELRDAWNEFTAQMSASLRKLGASLGPTLADALQSAKKALQDLGNLSIGQNLLHSLQGLGSTLKAVFVDTWVEIGRQVIIGLGQVGSGIISAFNKGFIQPIIEALGNLGSMIAKFFSNLPSQIMDLLSQAGSSFMEGFVNPIIEAFTNLKDSVVKFFQGAYDTATSILASIGRFFIDNLINPALDAFNSFAKLITDTYDSIAKTIKSAFDAVMGVIQPIIDTIKGWLQTLTDKASALMRILSGLSGGGGGEQPSGMARGGVVVGRGGIDTNLALLTAGEFVITKRAVDNFGAHFFHMLNNLQLPRFATGGLNIGGMSPTLGMMAHAATGTPRVLNLVIEGRSFAGMTVPENTAAALERFAVHSQIASTGRRPSWKR